MRATRRTARVLAAIGALAMIAAACNGDDGDTDADDTEVVDETDGNGESDPDDDTDDDPDEADDADNGDEDEAVTDGDGELTVYSGRNEELVGQVYDDFVAETGIELDVRYGDTADLAITLEQEGDASPADLYFAQDAGALGAIEEADRFVTLPDDVLDLVEENYRAPSGAWTGVTGRARVLAYNTDALEEDEVPDSVYDLTDPEWEGRIGWAPTNGSFQAFVTAMRLTDGEEETRQWLEDLIENDPVPFENNTAAVEGADRGEIDVALTNHYYQYRMTAEDPDLAVDNKYLPGDLGGLMNVAGIGVLESSENQEEAFELVRFLLNEDTQEYFGQVTDALEFPLRAGIDSPELPSLDELDPPTVDLSELEDLQGTLDLLNDVGALE